MTQEREINRPHGYMLDSDGRICLRFANWDTSQTHTVPDYITDVTYVDGPAAHDKSVHNDYVDSLI